MTWWEDATDREIREALVELVHRGIITCEPGPGGEPAYTFPDDPEEACRLLRESRRGGQ